MSESTSAFGRDSSAPTAPPRPSISVDLSAEPIIYSLDDENPPRLTFKFTSHASKPITVFTLDFDFNLLNIGRIFENQQLDILDLTSQQRLWQRKRQPGRGVPWKQTMGHPDERGYLTLLPEVPVTFSTPVSPMTGWRMRDPDKSLTFTPKYERPNAEVYCRFCEPGHKFRISVTEGASIRWWRWGTRDEVLYPAGTDRGRTQDLSMGVDGIVLNDVSVPERGEVKLVDGVSSLLSEENWVLVPFSCIQ